MSKTIISALRSQKQLRGNTLLIATELAHRMNPSGYGRVSYQFLAWKAHCCRQTAITHIAKLLALGLIRKTVIRTKEGYAWNHYQYVGPRVHTAFPPGRAHSPKPGGILPEAEREKETSLRQEVERQQKSRAFLTPGGAIWHRTQEEITRLEALLAATERIV